MSLIEENRRKQSFPSSPKIRQIQEGWKQRIDMTKSLKEKWMLLEDRKSVTFFKVIDAIVELGGPLLVLDSILIFPDELEVEVSKLKDKCAKEFDNFSNLSEDSIWAWTVDYVNLKKNISVIIYEAHDELN